MHLVEILLPLTIQDVAGVTNDELKYSDLIVRHFRDGIFRYNFLYEYRR
jgi:hypothetical protein